MKSNIHVVLPVRHNARMHTLVTLQQAQGEQKPQPQHYKETKHTKKQHNERHHGNKHDTTQPLRTTLELQHTTNNNKTQTKTTRTKQKTNHHKIMRIEKARKQYVKKCSNSNSTRESAFKPNST